MLKLDHRMENGPCNSVCCKTQQLLQKGNRRSWIVIQNKRSCYCPSSHDTWWGHEGSDYIYRMLLSLKCLLNHMLITVNASGLFLYVFNVDDYVPPHHLFSYIKLHIYRLKWHNSLCEIKLIHWPKNTHPASTIMQNGNNKKKYIFNIGNYHAFKKIGGNGSLENL